MSDFVYQTAGGTGTALTVTIKGTLVNGYPITFIASANNSGATTTINGKKLYKPGTTTAPNLIAGKAYTVWYNQAGDCFFIKASAEGDADASNVLANKKFSNDNDTGLVGTMPNNGQVIIMPGTTNKVINKGFHDGTGYVAGDTDLISSNIKAGINIFGVDGKSSVVDTADAIAGIADIVLNKTAYVNGTKVTGQATIQSLGGITGAKGSITFTAKGQTTNIAIGFIPSVVIVYAPSSISQRIMGIWCSGNGTAQRYVDYITDSSVSGTAATLTVNSNTITIGLYNASYGYTFYWVALP